MLIATKRLKIRTSNSDTGMLPGIVPTWPWQKFLKKWAWPGSHNPVNFWVMVIVSKWLKLRTTIWQACFQGSPDITTEKISKKERGKGRMTVTTVPCKLQQWDRYHVPQNVFLFQKNSNRKVNVYRSIDWSDVFANTIPAQPISESSSAIIEVKLRKALHKTPCQSYEASHAMRDHTVLAVSQHKWTHPTLNPTRLHLPTLGGWKAELT